MKIGITHRLFLTIMAAATLAVIAMFIIMQWSIDRGFLRYVNTLEQMQLARIAGELEEDYARQGSWNFLRDNPTYWRRLLISALPGQECDMPRMMEPGPQRRHGQDNPMMGRRHNKPPPENRHFMMRLFVLDAQKNSLFGPDHPPANAQLLSLRQQDKPIGYLGLLPLAHLTEAHELRFLKEQRLTLALVALAVSLVAAGLAFPLAGRLVQPIKKLTLAAQKLTTGAFSTRVEITSSDELGQLAHDFNILALTLEKNEKTRRQWVADISHELRTPLAILRAEIEALQDGVRPTTTESISSLHNEIIRLNRLVDDLYELSLSDIGGLTYRKEQMDLTALIDSSVASYQTEFQKKGIELMVNTCPKVLLFGDPERLQQLINNLLDNSVNYTNPGGSLILGLNQKNNT
ncbi:MAG: histidine kinase dimerization/phospho-acceptor domain-containing protein, partial [Desulfobulbaceae bacterium]|nr:histidine kinase dimerization/phospho-acceptor domain-containing protein [Desulfobulbaceae bacterium]